VSYLSYLLLIWANVDKFQSINLVSLFMDYMSLLRVHAPSTMAEQSHSIDPEVFTLVDRWYS